MNPPNAPPDSFGALMLDIASGRDPFQHRDGLPRTIVDDAAAYLGVSRQRLYMAVCAPGPTSSALVNQKGTLDLSVSTCVTRLAEIVLMALDVFESEGAVTCWLRTDNRAFLDSAPMDYITTEERAAIVRQVLNALASGGPV